MKFGLEIKRLRDDSKLTQRQLAEKIGVNQSMVAQLETGKRNDCTTATLFKLSDALGVDPSHWRPFLADTEPVKAEPKKPKGRRPKK